MPPPVRTGRLDAMAAQILPAAQQLASEMNATWQSSVYAKIVEVIENQLRLIELGS